MIWDWVEVDAIICDERQDPVPVSLPQVVSAEGFGSLLEVGTLYVPTARVMSYISGTGDISLAQAWRKESLPWPA